jgi:hypothetical protein
MDVSCLEDSGAPGKTETPSKARTSRAALSEFFASSYHRPRIRKAAKFIALEVCFDSDCDYYRATAVSGETSLWDLAFLRLYDGSLGLPAEFRARYASLASATFKRHSAGCEVQSEEALAKCVVLKLARDLDVSYWGARYDEGGRCQWARRLDNPAFRGKDSCRQLEQQ